MPDTLKLKKLKELIEEERDLAKLERDGTHFHTLEEFKVFEGKEKLCEKFLKFIEDE